MIKYLNDKGQTLVIFIILLPIVCLITFFFIQKLIFINEEVHLFGVVPVYGSWRRRLCAPETRSRIE